MGGEKDKRVAGLRQTARDCIKTGRYTEAFLHLSHAVKLDPGNLELLGERCRCSLDNLQFHFALQDAEEMVQLSPDCWLGHRSRAEVHLATLNYSQAIAAYQTAFQCRDSDKQQCKAGLDRCRREQQQDTRADMQLPWVATALAIAMSSLFIVLDFLSFGQDSAIAHPLLKILVCCCAAGLGWAAGRLYRLYTVKLRQQMLEPPPDLLTDFDLGLKSHPD